MEKTNVFTKTFQQYKRIIAIYNNLLPNLLEIN